MRRLALHASALSDSEYDLYTASLRDLSLEEGKAGKDEDAYFENITVGVREARAWLRGRYSNMSAPVIDGILRFFSPDLAQKDTLSGSEFFAVLRLVIHAENGREVDRSLAFVQADPSSVSNFPAASQQARSTPSSQAPSPAKRYADLPPPMPSRRPTVDAMSTSKSEPGSYNPFATQSQQSHPQPPLHPSQRSESSRSSHNPFVSRAPPPPKSEDGNSRLPPLPPRKPPPPIPPSVSSAPPPPPPRRSRADRSLSPSKAPETRSTVPPVPPPKLPHHVTSTLMKESLQASKIAQSMKKAEEHLEKERVMQVLKSSSSGAHGHGYTVRRAASPVRGRGHDISSASSASGSVERGAPPLPRRRHTQQQPSPPMSVSSLEQVALAVPPQSFMGDTKGKEKADFALSPFRSPIDPIPISAPPTTDRPTADGESSPVRSGPPPTHPDRKPYFGSNYQAPSSFEAVYGGMDSPSTPNGKSISRNDGSPTSRVFRSKSLHQPTAPAAYAPPPPVRRRRPESIQVLGSTPQTYPSPNSDGTILSRHTSLAKPSVHRRSSLSVSSTPTRELSPPRHASNSTSNPGSQSPLTSLQRTFATLQPKIDAFQPRLDAARYKAEAGLSRRGFIPSNGMSGSGAGFEEKEGLMGTDGGHHSHARGRRGTLASGKDDSGAGFDDPDVDSSSSGDDDNAWQRSKGMGSVLDRDSGPYTRAGDGLSQVSLDRGRGVVPGRSRNVFDDAYGADGVGVEQDNLKWPAGDGWKPL
ncbi:hypothetical protein BDN70DRAFT_881906 [Pholiota conissans]|uniref:Uncharacterized protein n=1 Tax=Pholiota conissans TaxID=109636 RepID=A0A9P5YW30_9AGAR|nr:hypothetical protein BDN70DRAFT_881906 [Pholiota conissans]